MSRKNSQKKCIFYASLKDIFKEKEESASERNEC